MSRVRYLLFPLGLLVALVILPGSASAKDGTVTVSAPGTDPSQVTVRLAALGSPDINNQAYALSSGRKQVSGYSMRRVLEEAEKESGGWLDLATIPSIEVDLPTAGVIRLSPEASGARSAVGRSRRRSALRALSSGPWQA